jgi:hypothetical protein
VDEVMNIEEIKKEIKDIILSEVYGECFEDTELNTAVEELSNLVAKSNEEAVRELKEAFYAGIEVTGEGFNGEYGMEDEDKEEAFNEFIYKTLKAEQYLNQKEEE